MTWAIQKYNYWLTGHILTGYKMTNKLKYRYNLEKKHLFIKYVKMFASFFKLFYSNHIICDNFGCQRYGIQTFRLNILSFAFWQLKWNSNNFIIFAISVIIEVFWLTGNIECQKLFWFNLFSVHLHSFENLF